jgi:cytochrome P450
MSTFLSKDIVSATTNLILWAITAGLITLSIQWIHYVFFHPLRRYPGPLLNRISTLPLIYHTIDGSLPFYAKSLFDQYGPVVRIAPNTLGFTSARAWKDIYNPRNGTVIGKDWKIYRAVGRPVSLFTADPEPHAMMRKWASPSFSERSMKQQEGIIGGYVDLLVKRLRQASNEGRQTVDLRDWYNFTTFDIIGKLAFSSDFGCLETSEYHPWVKMVNFSAKEATILGNFSGLLKWIPQDLLLSKSQRELMELTKEVTAKRVAAGSQTDFLEPFISNKDNVKLELESLQANADLFITAGSETTSTALAGVTYLLLTNKEAYAKVVEEVRSSYNSSQEISLTSVTKLSYMLACLNEGLRCYPPVSAWLPRVVNKGPANIDGNIVPQGVSTVLHTLSCFLWIKLINGQTGLGIWILPTFTSEQNFRHAEEFHPERFLGDPEFADDKLDVMNPFSMGQNDCIGRNLAYAEMRLILARILFNFDLTLAPDSREWRKNQAVYTFWQKPPLNVYLTPARC